MIKKNVNFENENSLSKYFKEVRKSVLLTPDEEVTLAMEIQGGNENAIEKLVNANLKFVVKCHLRCLRLRCVVKCKETARI